MCLHVNQKAIAICRRWSVEAVHVRDELPTKSCIWDNGKLHRRWSVYLHIPQSSESKRASGPCRFWLGLLALTFEKAASYQCC